VERLQGTDARNEEAMTPLLNRLEQAEIMRQVKRVLALQKRNRSSVLSSRMTEESEKASNKRALEELADILKEM
jgi:chromatin segregation and condensation protein Rec8/ScpA/Scc1 (kleisin family)